MHPTFFRTDLTPVQQQEFRTHARRHYTIGDPIDPDGLFHPIWVHEAATMNLEVWQKQPKQEEITEEE